MKNINRMLKEDDNASSMIKDKIFLMDVQTRIKEDFTNLVRRLFDDYKWLLSGGNYYYGPTNGQDNINRASDKAIEMAKRMLPGLINHCFEKASTEIKTAFCGEATDEPEEEKEAVKEIEVNIEKPAPSVAGNYFNY